LGGGGLVGGLFYLSVSISHSVLETAMRRVRRGERGKVKRGGKKNPGE